MTRQQPAVLSIFGVNPKRIGGVEMFARELSRQLHDAGYLSVLCFLRPPVDAVRNFLAGQNVRIHVTPGMLKPFTAGALELLRLLREYKPGVVHLHFTGFFMTPFPLVCRLEGVPHVFFTDHQSHPAGTQARPASLPRQLLARVLSTSGSTVLAVSGHNAGLIAATGLMPQARVQRFYNSVDFSRVASCGAEFRRRHGIPEQAVVVGQVGQLIPEKGVEDLLRAAQVVAAANRGVRFLVVGDGRAADRYARMAGEWGLQDTVTFVGPSINPFDEGVFAGIDILCAPSRWQEAFGWSVAEAMAHSKPVIVSNSGAFPEFVHDDATGYLVAPGDVRGLADRILELASNPGLRARMGAAGRRFSKEHFDLNQQISALLQLYGAPVAEPRTMAASGRL